MKVKDAEAGHGGLKPNAVDEEEGNTILHMYCARIRVDPRVKVNLQCVKAMVEWGVLPGFRNKKNETAFMVLMKPKDDDHDFVRPMLFSDEEQSEMIEIMKYLSSVTNHSAHNDKDEDEDDEHDTMDFA